MSLVLVLILLVLAIVLIRQDDYFKLVLFISLFSFTAACLYFIHAAPDIALAEIAIGCAFIPLIFTIAIMRQNVFTVVFYSQADEQAYCDPELLIEFMAIAEVFCAEHQLKLKITSTSAVYTPNVKGIFRLGNTDLVANYFEDTKSLMLWGNGRNKLLPKLAVQLKEAQRIHYEDAQMSIFQE